MDITRRQILQSGASLAAGAVSARAANDRIQVGFVGCGARAHELIRALMQVKGTAITGVVDAYKGRVERAVDRIGSSAKIYKSYKDILSDESIDAVVVVTPDHWHKTMVVDAVNAGKDVYCEKPLTFRSSEGPEIIA